MNSLPENLSFKPGSFTDRFYTIIRNEKNTKQQIAQKLYNDTSERRLHDVEVLAHIVGKKLGKRVLTNPNTGIMEITNLPLRTYGKNGVVKATRPQKNKHMVQAIDAMVNERISALASVLQLKPNAAPLVLGEIDKLIIKSLNA